MSAVVQVFSCPRCNRGGFRSLPGTDGKAHCPWCGDRVLAGGSAPAEPAPDPTPTPVSGSPAIPEADLRDRVARLEADLRREQEKKQEIKRAVMVEMAQLTAQATEAKSQLQAKEEEFLAVLLETKALKDEVARERKRADDLATERGAFGQQLNAVHSLEAELVAGRKTILDLQAARDAAGRDLQKARADLAKLQSISATELGELRKKLNTAVARGHADKNSGEELKALKAQHQETQAKAKSLQAELEKRDQRIKDLQLLIQTLGERLNELSKRHFGI